MPRGRKRKHPRPLLDANGRRWIKHGFVEAASNPDEQAAQMAVDWAVSFAPEACLRILRLLDSSLRRIGRRRALQRAGVVTRGMDDRAVEELYIQAEAERDRQERIAFANALHPGAVPADASRDFVCGFLEGMVKRIHAKA